MAGTQNQNKTQYIKNVKEGGIELADLAVALPPIPPKGERLLLPISSTYPAL